LSPRRSCRLSPARLPFVEAHELVVVGIARIVGIEPRDEGLAALDPLVDRLSQQSFGLGQETVGRDPRTLAFGQQRGLDIAKAVLPLAPRQGPVFEGRRLALRLVEAARARD